MKHDRAQTFEDVWQAVQDGAGSLHIVDKKLTVAVLSLIPANGEGKKEQEKKEKRNRRCQSSVPSPPTSS